MDDFLQIPSLGRPFDLGVLYDSRSDRIIAGPTLWNNEILKANLATGENANVSSITRILFFLFHFSFSVRLEDSEKRNAVTESYRFGHIRRAET